MDAILLLLRTGMQWAALDATVLCSHSSAHRRFREWTDAGVFERFWHDGLLADDAMSARPSEKARGRGAGSSNAHSWLNRYRRLLIRWEKRADTYLAMLHFACGLIVWNHALSG